MMDYEFIATQSLLEKHLNINNVDKLSKKEIAKIGKPFDPKMFELYKRNLFFEFFDKQRTPNRSFINKTNRLIKKLDLNLKSFEYKYLKSLVIEEFTLNRSRKILEIPFGDNLNYLTENATFHYRGIKIFRRNKHFFYERIFSGDLYFLKDQLVLFNLERGEIYRKIKIDAGAQITKNKYSINLQLLHHKNKEIEELIFTWENINILFITLQRMYSKTNLTLKDEK